MNHTQATVALFDKYANDYQEKYMDVQLYHAWLDEFCSMLKDNATVLEVACGPGNITRYLLDKRPDLKITGTDLSPNMLALARVNNPEAEFELMDAKDIGARDKQYDAILCGFCLPYLCKEEAVGLISDSVKALETGGVIYISTMEDDYSKSGWTKSSKGDELYMYYHEAGFLTEALAANNYKIVSLKRQPYPTNDGTKVTDMVILARLTRS